MDTLESALFRMLKKVVFRENRQKIREKKGAHFPPFSDPFWSISSGGSEEKGGQKTPTFLLKKSAFSRFCTFPKLVKKGVFSTFLLFLAKFQNNKTPMKFRGRIFRIFTENHLFYFHSTFSTVFMHICQNLVFILCFFGLLYTIVCK